MHIPTNMNVADGLTKPLLKTAFRKYAEQIRGIKTDINEYIHEQHANNVKLAIRSLTEWNKNGYRVTNLSLWKDIQTKVRGGEMEINKNEERLVGD